MRDGRNGLGMCSEDDPDGNASLSTDGSDQIDGGCILATKSHSSIWVRYEARFILGLRQTARHLEILAGCRCGENPYKSDKSDQSGHGVS
ncbi:hypothetical protein ACPOL_5860 [Acidisarcina polymorpha]|uniref:Uncharacterized protein n=1 Tax=Acidisarcina polymorpha TaxID=2211140 RepID=A0A2Z5G8S8_9BACT|nr:hypothetical protein ACPOL_5860 [Acidisarcina polymorpha]